MSATPRCQSCGHWEPDVLERRSEWGSCWVLPARHDDRLVQETLNEFFGTAARPHPKCHRNFACGSHTCLGPAAGPQERA